MQWSDVTFLDSVFHLQQLPDMNLPVFAFSGRSNVGKSTLLNAVWGRKNFARVSSRPGKTRSLNFFLIDNKCCFIDLPGYGYAGGAHQEKLRWKKLIEEVFLSSSSLARIFLLLDIRHPLQESDRLMVEFLVFHDLPYTIILTKADKLSRQKQQKQLQLFADTLSLSSESFILFSSVQKTGINSVRSTILNSIQ